MVISSILPVVRRNTLRLKEWKGHKKSYPNPVACKVKVERA